MLIVVRTDRGNTTVWFWNGNDTVWFWNTVLVRTSTVFRIIICDVGIGLRDSGTPDTRRAHTPQNVHSNFLLKSCPFAISKTGTVSGLHDMELLSSGVNRVS